ncbi:hypothetical protein, partial [Nevskia soli]|uniref:hypothetical protein n=1 Tax=Nevskia soli TaxID=418856 RepID=UPI001B7FF337
MSARKQRAGVRQEQIRGWNLSAALILEVVQADVAPLFMLRACNRMNRTCVAVQNRVRQGGGPSHGDSMAGADN